MPLPKRLPANQTHPCPDPRPGVGCQVSVGRRVRHLPLNPSARSRMDMHAPCIAPCEPAKPPDADPTPKDGDTALACPDRTRMRNAYGILQDLVGQATRRPVSADRAPHPQGHARSTAQDRQEPPVPLFRFTLSNIRPTKSQEPEDRSSSRCSLPARPAPSAPATRPLQTAPVIRRPVFALRATPGTLRPKRPPRGCATRSPKGEAWWAWEDLNFRPHAYQARALTN